MVRQLELIKSDRVKSESLTITTLPNTGSKNHGGTTERTARSSGGELYECVALHVNPDLGERIMLSGDRSLLDEIFPETNHAIMDARTGAAWNQQDVHHVIRFPLNGRLNGLVFEQDELKVISRLLQTELDASDQKTAECGF